MYVLSIAITEYDTQSCFSSNAKDNQRETSDHDGKYKH